MSASVPAWIAAPKPVGRLFAGGVATGSYGTAVRPNGGADILADGTINNLKLFEVSGTAPIVPKSFSNCFRFLPVYF